MADSKRLKILKALTVHLEGTPGYSLTGKVWRGRRNPGDETSLPFLILFELPPDGESRADASERSMPWVLGVQGYIATSGDHLTDTGHDLMAAVKQRLSLIVDDGGEHQPGPEYMLDGLLADFQVDGGLVFSPDETMDCCFFVVKLTLWITENLSDPYNS